MSMLETSSSTLADSTELSPPTQASDVEETGCPLALPQAFDVHDGSSANWLVRKVGEARAYAARVRAWAAAELRRAEREEAWLLDRFGPALEAWLRAELGRQGGGRRRSVALPAGTLGLRQQPARLEVVDEPRAAQWCARHRPEALRIVLEAEGPAAVELLQWQGEHGEAARRKEHVLREPLGRHLAETGELPDGATLRPAEDVFYVK